jgi:hypothetical protein
MVTVRGGDQLEKRLREIADALGNKGAVKVGFLENATYPNGTPVAMIALIQDSGAPNAGIPPRPFFRNMVASKSPEWPKAIYDLLKQTNYDGQHTLALIGEAIKAQLQQSIRDTNTPPLKPATVKRKGFDKPLIETSHMINSVDYEVVTE